MQDAYNERCAVEAYELVVDSGVPVAHRLSEMDGFSICFGRLKAGGWAWLCGCTKCAQADSPTAFGPYKTERQARRDFERTVLGPRCKVTDAPPPQDLS
jgi:hypothetical protein